MKKIIMVSLLICSSLMFQEMPATYAQSKPETELLEQALIQQLYPVIYNSLQELYNEKFPQFDEMSIIHIDSFITGTNGENNDSNRQASASGGAKIFNITVQVRAIHHHEIVHILMSNELNGAMYTVTKISKSKYTNG